MLAVFRNTWRFLTTTSITKVRFIWFQSFTSSIISIIGENIIKIFRNLINSLFQRNFNWSSSVKLSHIGWIWKGTFISLWFSRIFKFHLSIGWFYLMSSYFHRHLILVKNFSINQLLLSPHVSHLVLHRVIHHGTVTCISHHLFYIVWIETLN